MTSLALILFATCITSSPCPNYKWHRSRKRSHRRDRPGRAIGRSNEIGWSLVWCGWSSTVRIFILCASSADRYREMTFLGNLLVTWPVWKARPFGLSCAFAIRIVSDEAPERGRVPNIVVSRYRSSASVQSASFGNVQPRQTNRKPRGTGLAVYAFVSLTSGCRSS